MVTTDAPTVTGVRRAPVVHAIASAFHVTTREEVIRRFLLFRTGEPCSDLRRAESERILRAQNFLADTHIETRPSTTGGVVVTVHSTDEVSLVLGGS
ncbi:MAG TPA: hypothetical protein VIV65_12350, partial [Gemmatimonadaceae bacterium]